MKAMKRVIPGAELPVSYLTNGNGYDVEGGEKITQTLRLPFYRTASGACVIRWRLSWAERWRMILTGDIWHVVKISDDRLQPIELHGSCPLNYSSEEQSRYGLTQPHAKVYMSGRDMMDAAGECETGWLRVVNRKYEISGKPELGAFSTENGALEAYAAYLRKKNKGKWWER